MITRLKELRQQAGLRQVDLAKKIGIAQNTLSYWEQGKCDIDIESLRNIADFFGCTVDYLLYREEDKKINTAPDIKPNAVFLDNKKIRMLPLYETVSAGFGAYASDEIVDYVPCFIENDYEADNSICLKVWGDSMSPKIESGDVIQVIKQSSVDSGSIAVVLLDEEEGLVKRVVYGKTWIELHSLNPAYPTQRFEKEDVLRLRVVGKVKKIIKDV